MLDFVGYLKDAKATSAPVTKLYNLCLPFCALASTVIKNTNEPQANNGEDSRPSKRQKFSTASHIDQLPTQQDTETTQTYGSTQQEQETGAPQVFEAAARFGEQNNDLGIGLNDDDFFAQFMDFQPRLQWLDTDFSAFEETWEQTGFGGYGDDGMGDANF